MKKLSKKLQLGKQTLRILDQARLTNVAGGDSAIGNNRNNTVCTKIDSGCVSGGWCEVW